MTQRIETIDSHTGGEPTRVVLSGGPDLGTAPLSERLELFREYHDTFRSTIVNEPRGSAELVGALICPPVDPDCACGVIFFNNVGYIGMCVHGTIGLVVTLAHLGKIAPGTHRLETPVGEITATLHDDGQVTVTNVPSYVYLADVKVEVPELGTIVGDVAWGGNWFFLVNDHQQELALTNAERLVDVSWRIRQALVQNNITGSNNDEIDHIELFSPTTSSHSDSKNFVLCPGKAYDRSPCGTGTSAKLACLAAAGKLPPGQIWRQESIVGSVFEGFYEPHAQGILPSVKGSAFITAETTLLVHPDDPFAKGIRP
jgi:4-hydroxyproline epimerase